VKGTVGHLTSPLLIHVKGILFLFLGLLSSSLIIIENPTLRSGLLLAVCVWAFCRFYYYTFYVIERYVDLNFRFSGLFSFLRYVFHRNARGPTKKEP
jgi:hypothetical protein